MFIIDYIIDKKKSEKSSSGEICKINDLKLDEKKGINSYYEE
jgi:hypothetical protein